ncbi:MAG: hypothetical protein WCI18_06070 [Pseudomonadota bacterium]
MNPDTSSGSEQNAEYEQDSRRENEPEGSNPAINTEHPSSYLPPARR